ncbi:MAG TPA: hypothetical protein VFW50_32895 [Streptosporangiaceae bacterium]|nr:hypothetical protein [Streptosporangiaceae bacterium]
MSDDESDPAGPEATLLADMKALRRRTRTARHAYWFPLVLFGLLTCASVPFYVLPGPPAGGTGTVPGSPLPVLGGFAGVTGSDWSLTSLPNVLLPALVLLATGAGAFAVQRPHRARP